MARRKEQGASGSREHVAVLTRTDAKGGQHPLPAPRYGEQSLQGSKGKGKKTKVDTHQSGQRVRYFADDDKYSLNQMVKKFLEISMAFTFIQFYKFSINEKNWIQPKTKMPCFHDWLASG